MMRNVDPQPEPMQGEEADFLARGGRPLLPPGEEGAANGDPELPESFGAGIAEDSTEAFARGGSAEEKDEKSQGDQQKENGKAEPQKKEAKGEQTPPPKGPPWEMHITSGAGAPMEWTIRARPAEQEKEDKKKEWNEEEDQEKEGKGGEDGKKEKGGEEKKDKLPPVYKRPGVIAVFVILLLVLIGGAVLWWLYARQFVSTDDAYIDGNVTQISPQVSAPILARHIDDNTYVKKGDLMVELDPTDFEVALQRATAAAEAAQGKLGQAQTQIGAAQATIAQNQAEIDAAQVQLDNTTADLKRYEDVDPRARTQQQLDNAIAAQKNAAAQLEQAKARKNTAQANLKAQQAAVNAAQGDLDSALADERRARVDLGYCKIFAPSDGRVTSRTIDVGMYVNPGQAIFSIVSPDVWVTANFKETQLTRMRVGQSVTIKGG